METNTNGVPYNPAAVAITGGSITGQTGTPYIAIRRFIPFIVASSGTMGNNGALTALAALNRIYPRAYLYLPANAISAGSTAGWYYAEGSSTTAFTVYNVPYTTGIPTIPTVKTAFATTGPGAFTGDVNEQGFAVPIAAGAMGQYGGVEGYCIWSAIGAGTHTFRVRLGASGAGTGGTQFLANSGTSTYLERNIEINNDGSAAAQIGITTANYSEGATANTATTTAAINTANASEVYISAQHGTATDHAIIEGVSLAIVNPG